MAEEGWESPGTERPDQLPLAVARQRALCGTSCSIQQQRYKEGTEVGTHPGTWRPEVLGASEFHASGDRRQLVWGTGSVGRVIRRKKPWAWGEGTI